MGPDEARLIAVDYVKAGWRGTDPIAEKRAAHASRIQVGNTLDGLFAAFYSQREARLRRSSAKLVHSRWNRLILPEVGSRSISSIKRSFGSGYWPLSSIFPVIVPGLLGQMCDNIAKRHLWRCGEGWQRKGRLQYFVDFLQGFVEVAVSLKQERR
jgi:hypothetical protein